MTIAYAAARDVARDTIDCSSDVACWIRELVLALRADPAETFTITLWATIAGAIVGGLVTYRFTRRLAIDQAAREDRRILEQSRREREQHEAQLRREDDRAAIRRKLDDDRAAAQLNAARELYEDERRARLEELLDLEIAATVERLQLWRTEAMIDPHAAERTHLAPTQARTRRSMSISRDADTARVFDWVGQNLPAASNPSKTIERRLNGIIEVLVDWRVYGTHARDVLGHLKAL